MGSSERDISKICVGAKLKKGLSITGSNAENSKQQVESWLKSVV